MTTSTTPRAMLSLLPIVVVLASLASLADAKVYERCELARELQNKWAFPANQIATWVCIAYHESRYDMSAIGRLNTDGSADYGIFQINDRYWCDQGAAGCAVSCDTLLTDMSEVTKCVKKVYAESKKLLGNGFMAWTTYKYCKSPDSYIQNCELDGSGSDGDSPALGCVPFDGVCVGNNGTQANCCEDFYCQKNKPSWKEGRCYYRSGSQTLSRGSPALGCVPFDGACVGKNGTQANCCEDLYCQKNKPWWKEGRCYYRSGSQTFSARDPEI